MAAIWVYRNLQQNVDLVIIGMPLEKANRVHKSSLEKKWNEILTNSKQNQILFYYFLGLV